jgi:hypothetical protein
MTSAFVASSSFSTSSASLDGLETPLAEEAWKALQGAAQSEAGNG